MMHTKMLSEETLAIADAYWADDIGCPQEIFAHEGVTFGRPLDANWNGVFVFRRGPFWHINAPDDVMPLIKRAHNQMQHDLLDVDWWQQLLAGRFLRAIGPAYVGYADKTFTPVQTPKAVLLSSHDEEALQRFATRNGETAWQHSGLEEPQPRVACWLDEELAAVAGYRVWGERIAHIGVASDPAQRGRGYGKAVVSAIGRMAQQRGLLLQYRTLEANMPSMAIAAALGFHGYATTLALRLHD